MRWYRGGYYISRQPADSLPDYWRVQRLLMAGRQLRWQTLGNDTLRIAVLPAGVVRRKATGGRPRWFLHPTTRRQERQVAEYAGLWESERELKRQ